jgi:hypothetical protein
MCKGGKLKRETDMMKEMKGESEEDSDYNPSNIGTVKVN